jgi:hypothetical protein
MRSAVRQLVGEYRGSSAPIYLWDESSKHGLEMLKLFERDLETLDRVLTATHARLKGKRTEAPNAPVIRLLFRLAVGFWETYSARPTTTLDGPFYRAASGVVAVAMGDEDGEPDHRAVQKALKAYRAFANAPSGGSWFDPSPAPHDDHSK